MEEIKIKKKTLWHLFKTAKYPIVYRSKKDGNDQNNFIIFAAYHAASEWPI